MDHLIDLIKGLSDKHYGAIVNLRRELHKFPELSFSEHETTMRIAQELNDIGITTFSGVAGTGVIGIIEGEKPGKILGIRAELDALPVVEETNLSYASVNHGVMHACGHDVHMSNLVGAAKILWALRSEIKGKILLIFQPGEELLPGGAQSVMDSDVFQKKFPDLMVGLHILPELEMGKVGFREGPYMASGDEIYIKVMGKGGHAALPHTYVNPIPIASQIIIDLQQKIVPEESKNIPSVLAFGKFIANGATNIIPESVSIEGTFRTMNEEWREFVRKEIDRIASETAGKLGGNCSTEIRKGYPSVYNNPKLTQEAVKHSEKYLGKQNVEQIPIRMTTDDFAYYSQKIPSVYFRIGIKEENTGLQSLHSSKLVVNDSILSKSAGLTAWLALNLLNENP